jgi:7-keto-8-aminopelargonate synthetase-like enzyme
MYSNESSLPSIYPSIQLLEGTLSKAIGSLGGFIVVHTPLLRSFVLDKGRPLVYSTSLPISLVQCAIENIDLGMSSLGSQMRDKLRRNVNFLKQALVAAGFSKQEEKDNRGIYLQPNSIDGSPIIPLRMPSEHSATDASQYFKDNFGLHVPAIRPPTVPAGTSRLRIAVTATHNWQDLRLLVRALEDYKRNRCQTLSAKL